MNEKKNQHTGIVLLHGAGLGAWVWDKVIENLDYPAIAVDFPGRGKHSNQVVKDLSLADYVTSVYQDIEQFNDQKIVIVAHSISGIIGLELANLLGERLIGFVAVGATIPPGNGSFISSLPRMKRTVLRLMLKLAGTKPPETAMRIGLCHDLDESDATEVVNRFVPESRKLFTDKMQGRGALPYSLYVQLTEDKELNEAMQQRMIAHMQPDEVAQLSSGHLPMLSKPEMLAQIINKQC